MDTRDRRLALPLLPLLLACLACWIATTAAAEEYVGAETCAACHEEVVQAFRLTAHATEPGWNEETGCESCHGPGGEHAEGDTETIIRPRQLPAREATAICLECHRRQEQQFRSRHAVHTLAEVTCIDCHDPHSTADRLLPERGIELCGKCHRSIAAQFELPRHHPLPERGIGCEGCHNPHTTVALRRSMGYGNATCKGCHIEKAGPFLYAHDVTLVDDCSTCHSVHGSSNRHLLRHERLINLCYQCHPATQTPTFHNAANFLNEKCTACHTAIHGSNTNPFFLEE